MNLKELHIKGELSEKGYLKESFDEEKDDLKHELTELGRNEIKEILKEPFYQKMFIKLALEESKNHPEIAGEIMNRALNRLK